MDKEKQIEEMVKFVCMDCRYFMRCNDDTMCDGRTLGETLKEDCWTRKYAQILYNANYRKQIEGEWVWKTKIEPRAQNRLYCSVCDKECLGKNNYYEKSNFCPYCGAKMKGGE